MHILHHLRRPELPIANKRLFRFHTSFLSLSFHHCYMATRHNSKSAFEKLCRRPPEPIFLKSESARLWLNPYFASVSLRKRQSSSLISKITASLPSCVASPPR